MATSVHYAWLCRWKGDAAFFLDGQGVNVSTEGDDWGSRADSSYHTGLCNRIPARKKKKSKFLVRK
jgi:hypothetical protein